MRVRSVNDEMRLKYRAAERLGLTDKLLQVGWGGLSRRPAASAAWYPA